MKNIGNQMVIFHRFNCANVYPPGYLGPRWQYPHTSFHQPRVQSRIQSCTRVRRRSRSSWASLSRSAGTSKQEKTQNGRCGCEVLPAKEHALENCVFIYIYIYIIRCIYVHGIWWWYVNIYNKWLIYIYTCGAYVYIYIYIYKYLDVYMSMIYDGDICVYIYIYT